MNRGEPAPHGRTLPGQARRKRIFINVPTTKSSVFERIKAPQPSCGAFMRFCVSKNLPQEEPHRVPPPMGNSVISEDREPVGWRRCPLPVRAGTAIVAEKSPGGFTARMVDDRQ